MPVEHLEVLVEEPSMEAALRLLLPKIIGDTSFEIYPYQGKTDLLQKLPARLRGYSKWLPPNHRILVLVDRDSDDCKHLKGELEAAAKAAGMPTKSKAAADGSFSVVNRIVIEELEAWFFGDWAATMTAYPGASANLPRKAKFRDPDGIGNTWEALEQELQRAGYFRGGLEKIEAARSIATHMDPGNNRSHSFNSFRTALVALQI